MPEGKIIRGDRGEWEFHCGDQNAGVGANVRKYADDLRDVIKKLKKRTKSGESVPPGMTFDIEFDASFESPSNIRLLHGGDPDSVIQAALEKVAVLQEQQLAEQQEKQKQQDEIRRQREEAERPQRMEESGQFYNPYSFVQGLDRQGLTGELSDSAPQGHHRLHNDSYTGWIDLQLTTKTPLLIPDAESQSPHPDKPLHFIYGIRRDAEANPYFPPTSLKGVLSAAYEAVTNSRLRMLNTHDRPLGFRRDAEVNVAPYRVTGVTPDSLTLQPMKLTKLEAYSKSSSGVDRGCSTQALRYSCSENVPKHLDHVRVKLDNKNRVLSIREYAGSSSSDGQEGWVLWNNPNNSEKRFERVFVASPSQPVTLTGEEARRVMSLWSHLINDYQRIHKKELEKRKADKHQPTDYLGDEPGNTAWSRHVYASHEDELVPGRLLYVAKNGSRIDGVFPVAISRELFPEPPRNLIYDSLKPATSIDQLSPADRVFGWVHQKAEQGRSSGAGPVAWKGQLRIDRIVCKTADAIVPVGKNGKGIPLAILSEPKPSQASFYVSEKDGEPVRQKNSGYKKDQQLRHRKVYPHHGAVSGNDEYWSDEKTETQREFRRFNDEPDSQNRSITEWIKPESQFTTRIHVTNLSKVELGALLWLLSLDQQYAEHQHYLRAGGAKPLGFGSLTVKISGTDLRTGNQWRGYFQDLSDSADDLDSAAQDSLTDDAISAYKKAVVDAWPGVHEDSTFEKVSFIEGWIAACRGFNAPVHYPRTTSSMNAETKIYDWFGKVGAPLPTLREHPHRLQH